MSFLSSCKLSFACAAVLAAGSGVASAQAVVTELSAVGKPFPGTFPPFSPSSYALASVASNGKAGYAIQGVGGSSAFIWGRATPGVPSGGNFFALSNTLPPPGLSSFLTRIGLSDSGSVLFSGSSPQSLWTQAGPIAKQPDAMDAPLQTALGTSGKFYSQFLSTYGYSPDGVPVWRATYSSSAGAAPEFYSLVRGLPSGSPTVLLKMGQAIPGSPQPISMASAQRGWNTTSVGFAPGNNNYIAEGFIERAGGVDANTDQVLVVNGVAATLGANIVRERDVIDDPRANVGENWRGVGHADINDAGDYVFTSQTFTPGGSLLQVLANNSQLLLKQNDVLDFLGTNYTLGATIGETQINESGDWAVAWGTAAGGNVLIANGAIVAAGGVTQYDLDENGTPDATLGRVGLGADKMAITDRFEDGSFNVYFFGSESTGAREGVYAINVVVPEPASIGLIGLPAMAALRRRRR